MNVVVTLCVVSSLITLVISIAAGWIVAASAGRPWWTAVLIGAAVPMLGPVIWGGAEYLESKKEGYTSRSGHSLSDVITVTGLLWWAATAALVVALFLPWLSASSTIETRFDGQADLTPIESVFGAILLGGCALVLSTSALLVGWAAPSRLAIVNLLVAGLLLVVSLDSRILFEAVDDAGDALSDYAGHTFRGHISAGPALWLTSGAGCLAVVGSLSASIRASRRRAPAATRAISPGPNPIDDVNPDGGWR